MHGKTLFCCSQVSKDGGNGGFGPGPTRKLPYPKGLRVVATNKKEAQASDLLIPATVATLSFVTVKKMNKLNEEHD
jgi:hypothetical protein